MQVHIPKDVHAAVIKVGIWYLLGEDGNIPLSPKEERNSRAFLDFLYELRENDVKSIERSFFQQFRQAKEAERVAVVEAAPAAISIVSAADTEAPILDIGKQKEVKTRAPTMEEVLALVAAGGIPETTETPKTTERSEGTPDSSFFQDAGADQEGNLNK